MWEKVRDNAGFGIAVVSLIATIVFGLNVDKVFDVTRPYFLVPYGVILFAAGCFAGWWFRDALKSRQARADFEREQWRAEQAERKEREEKEHEAAEAEQQAKKAAEREDAENVRRFQSITDARTKAIAKILVEEMDNHAPVLKWYWERIEESERWIGYPRQIFEGDVQGTNKVILSAREWVHETLRSHPELVSELSASDVDAIREELEEQTGCILIDGL